VQYTVRTPLDSEGNNDVTMPRAAAPDRPLTGHWRRTPHLTQFLSDEGRRMADAIEELAPTIRAQAVEAETRGRLSDEVIARLTDIGLYKTVRPLEYGGYALGARDTAEIAQALGRADASAGWTFLVASSLRMVSTFPKALVDDLYDGADEWAGPPAAGGSTFAAITGTGRKVDGGWMVKGKWTFVSGNHHAKRIFGGLAWTDGARSGHGLVMFDADQLVRLDDWHVSGMSASDSNSMVAEDEVFVPDHRFVDMAELPKHMDSASSRYTGLAYQAQALGSMLTVMVLNIGNILGIGQTAFDLFVEQSQTKKPFSPPYPSLAVMPAVQITAGKARARLTAAEKVLLSWAHEIDLVASSGRDFHPAEEAQASLDLSYAGSLVAEALDMIQQAIGTSTVPLSNPIQRYVRDVRVILTHGAIRLEPLAEISGRHLLGQPPFDMFAGGLQNKEATK
jgi:alkylation response protein AidB-like acyl-CoA dehydrogenase